MHVDGRPRGGSDVADVDTTLTFADVGATAALLVQGFATGGLVAARTDLL